jgi:hypothetical protein
MLLISIIGNQSGFFFSYGIKAMRYESVLYMVVSLFVLFVARIPSAEGRSSKHELTIVYTNDVQGEIEPCG